MVQTHSSNGHSHHPPQIDAKNLLETPIAPNHWTLGASPDPLVQEGNGSNGGNSQSNEDSNPPHEKPDFWNYLLVGILSFFYLASLVSTYISSNLLLYLLSGGGIVIPMFGMKIPLTEAVALMGSGLLEGASLGDAYLEHKGKLPKEKKWLSRGGRFLAFVGQWLLYYMAVGTLLFSTADVNNLSGQELETSSTEEAVLVLNPPTLLHGIFVVTITGAWSFASNYVGIDALFVAISCLRRKKRAEDDDDEGDLEFFLSLLAQLQDTLKDFEMAREMETLAMQLKQIYEGIEKKQVHSDLSAVFHHGISDILSQIPDSKLKRKGWSRDKLKEILAQSLLSEKAAEKSLPKPQTPPTIPPGFFL
ncbi:hypothetical protein [Nostoc sp. C110]|uniref:hypothetical protein n=1 Tax=Nostoc sp. C110 TaxID=3349876 RepID=UPI00370D7BFC